MKLRNLIIPAMLATSPAYADPAASVVPIDECLEETVRNPALLTEAQSAICTPEQTPEEERTYLTEDACSWNALEEKGILQIGLDAKGYEIACLTSDERQAKVADEKKDLHFYVTNQCTGASDRVCTVYSPSIEESVCTDGELLVDRSTFQQNSTYFDNKTNRTNSDNPGIDPMCVTLDFDYINDTISSLEEQLKYSENELENSQQEAEKLTAALVTEQGDSKKYGEERDDVRVALKEATTDRRRQFSLGLRQRVLAFGEESPFTTIPITSINGNLHTSFGAKKGSLFASIGFGIAYVGGDHASSLQETYLGDNFANPDTFRERVPGSSLYVVGRETQSATQFDTTAHSDGREHFALPLQIGYESPEIAGVMSLAFLANYTFLGAGRPNKTVSSAIDTTYTAESCLAQNFEAGATIDEIFSGNCVDDINIDTMTSREELEPQENRLFSQVHYLGGDLALHFREIAGSRVNLIVGSGLGAFTYENVLGHTGTEFSASPYVELGVALGSRGDE